MIRKVISLSILFVMVFSVAVAAEPWRGWKGSGGWGSGGQYHKVYDVGAVEVVVGTVESVETFVPFRGMSIGVIVNLKMDEGVVAVHLGPAWFVDRQDVKLEKGDTVEVTGSKVAFDDNAVIIAKEVKKGNNSLKLRDENGTPYWSVSTMTVGGK